MLPLLYQVTTLTPAPFKFLKILYWYMEAVWLRAPQLILKQSPSLLLACKYFARSLLQGPPYGLWPCYHMNFGSSLGCAHVGLVQFWGFSNCPDLIGLENSQTATNRQHWITKTIKSATGRLELVWSWPLLGLNQYSLAHSCCLFVLTTLIILGPKINDLNHIISVPELKFGAFSQKASAWDIRSLLLKVSDIS